MFCLHMHMVHHPVSKNAAESGVVLGPDHRARDVNYSRKALSRDSTDFKIDQRFGLSEQDFLTFCLLEDKVKRK